MGLFSFTFVKFETMIWPSIRFDYKLRRGSTPASVVLRKSVRFFVIDIFLINNKKNFPRLGASSKVNGTNQYPVWMTQRPRKGDFRSLKSKKAQREACPRTPLKACAFGAHLGNRSVFLLDLRLKLIELWKALRRFLTANRKKTFQRIFSYDSGCKRKLWAILLPRVHLWKKQTPGSRLKT